MLGMTSGADWLIAGLGNPEPKYDGTRHNAGFEALDYLAAQWHCDIAKAKWQGLYGTAQVGDHKVVLLKPLTYIKYAVLLFMVVLMPMLIANDVGMGDPFFCKYLCPQGVLEGAIPLAAVNSGIRAALGALFSWKLGILITVIVLSVLFYRPFCKWLCPLGAFYALLNKVSLFGMKVDKHKCVSCGKCAKACKMDVDVTKAPDHTECIRCGMCVRACPTNAVSFRYGFGNGKETDRPAEKTETPKQISDTEKE